MQIDPNSGMAKKDWSLWCTLTPRGRHSTQELSPVVSALPQGERHSASSRLMAGQRSGGGSLSHLRGSAKDVQLTAKPLVRYLLRAPRLQEGYLTASLGMIPLRSLFYLIFAICKWSSQGHVDYQHLSDNLGGPCPYLPTSVPFTFLYCFPPSPD
uniref:Uncharacterized protein n=1 Tax=Myotis myotis TaxID=51298 RepID=A0A7J7TTS6_MYOMY|nr:hypothetical protein mMyoMyo1_008974 [Myotis myotis]